jgi:hypothetical protein
MGALGGASRQAESLPIGGVAYITVFGPQGQVVQTWHGHNTLTAVAINDIASCLSGTRSPGDFTSCSGFTNWIEIGGCVQGATSCSFFTGTPATDTISSVDSNGNAASCSPGSCNGWTLTGLFSSAALAGCNPSCTIAIVNGAQVGPGTQSGPGTSFDRINNPGITVAAGDSLQITIVFTVS